MLDDPRLVADPAHTGGNLNDRQNPEE